MVSGAVGEWLGWREMYVMATGLMTLSAIAAFRILPDTRPNFSGSYGALMRSLFTLLRQYPLLRLYSVRAAFAFGALLCFWASLAFKMAQAPFHAGSDIVGILGLCGIAGALTATVAGKYITRVGIHRFNCIGALLQFIAWALFLFGAESYASFVFGIVAIDIGMQCIQLSNQAPLFGLCPAASNRINTIFMSTYFAGGTLGTFLSGAAWGALRLAGRRGCRSAALRRLAVAHAPQRKIAPHRTARYGPPPYSGRAPGIRHNRPQAL